MATTTFTLSGPTANNSPTFEEVSRSTTLSPTESTTPSSSTSLFPGSPFTPTNFSHPANPLLRTLPCPSTRSSWLPQQLPPPSTIIVPHRHGHPEGGSSSALFREFSDTDSLEMSVQGLVGCTSVVVVSRRGVYMSHLFENPGFFSHDPITHQRIPRGRFETDILAALAHGDATPQDAAAPQTEPWVPSLCALSRPHRPLAPTPSNPVRVMIVTPYSLRPSLTRLDTYVYAEQVEELALWLRALDRNVEVVGYFPGNAWDGRAKGERDGKVEVLFEPSCGGEVRKGWDLWVEGTKRAGDRW